MGAEITTYLKEHKLYPLQLKNQVSQHLGCIVVIPCYNECGLLQTLQSLYDCHRPEKIVEVIVVINSAEFDTDEVISNNQNAYWEAEDWASKRNNDQIKFYFLNLISISSDIAGVGLARKIGMDEALARFDKANNPEGVIVSLDADCSVSKNYLQEIEQWFDNNRDKEAASLYYEFPQNGNEDQRIFEAAARFELSGRYIAEGLRYAQFPFAFETHGFAFAVRAKAYLMAGGMSKRKSQESFYFLSNLTHQLSYGTIQTLCVYPKARKSVRVPKGSAYQISEWLKQKNENWPVYHPDAFSNLRTFTGQIKELYQIESLNDYNHFIMSLPPAIIAYLSESSFYEQWQELQVSALDETDFQQQFYKRFNRIWVESYLIASHDTFYKKISVVDAYCKICGLISGLEIKNKTLSDCLVMARNRQTKTYSIRQKVAS